MQLPVGYQFIEVLGEGATSIVVKARHLATERETTIKVMRQEQLLDETARERFKREAQVLASLNHRHILKILAFGLTPDGAHPYIVSEFLQGQTLDKHLKDQGALSPPDFKRIFLSLAEALEYLHKSSVIHRDIKPSNIFITKDSDALSPRFIDFGLARVLGDATQPGDLKLTQTGTVMGSPAYMSPEQCAGKRANERSDIYSLGCVMYECLAGVPPFSSDSPMEAMYKHMNEPPPALKVHGVEAFGDLEELLMKMLSKDPVARPATAGELVSAFAQTMTGRHFEKMLSTPKTTARPSVWFILAGCTVMVLALAVAFKSIQSANRKDLPPVQAVQPWVEIERARREYSLSYEMPADQALATLRSAETTLCRVLNFEKSQPHPQAEILYCTNITLGMVLEQKSVLLKDPSGFPKQAKLYYSHALKAAEQSAGKVDPEASPAYQLLGELALKRKDYLDSAINFDNAIKCLNEADDIKPGGKHLRLDHSMPGKASDRDLARCTYRKGAAIWLSETDEAQGEQLHREAIQLYLKLSKLLEQDAIDVYANMIEHYATAGQFEKAKRELAELDKLLQEQIRLRPRQTRRMTASFMALAYHLLAIPNDTAFDRKQEYIKYMLEAERYVSVNEPGVARPTAIREFREAAAICRQVGRNNDASKLEKAANEIAAAGPFTKPSASIDLR